VPLDVVKESLATFRGVARRFTVVAEPEGIALVDDYGHHPAEIKATLQAARNAYRQRILVAFQPHRHTRTSALFQEFAQAFDQADSVFVSDIYAAGEAPIAGVSSEALTREMTRNGHRSAHYVADREDLCARIASAARPGDVVIALGAGDINRSLARIEQLISARSGNAGEEARR
jgi:UDP-N-acetylmuramate--alanine ligase